MKPIESMTTTAFRTSALQPQSFMQKLLKQYPEENAIIELNNLLATRNILDVSQGEISQIENKYKISLSGEYSLNLEEFYAVHLKHNLTYDGLNGSSQAELQHLRLLFNLSSAVIDMLHIRIGGDIYQRKISEALKDGYLSDSEKANLKELQISIGLPNSVCDEMIVEVKRNRIQSLFKTVSRNARLSPEEAALLVNQAKALDIDLTEELKADIERYAKYWQLESGLLPSIDAEFPLQKDELICFKIGKTQWLEERVSTRSSNTDDRFFFGLDFQLIDLNTNLKSKKQEHYSILKEIDSGSLYITTKRLIYAGFKKTTSIKLNTLVHLEAYEQGLLIQKSTGRPILITTALGADDAVIIVRRLLRNNNDKENSES